MDDQDQRREHIAVASAARGLTPASSAAAQTRSACEPYTDTRPGPIHRPQARRADTRARANTHTDCTTDTDRVCAAHIWPSQPHAHTRSHACTRSHAHTLAPPVALTLAFARLSDACAPSGSHCRASSLRVCSLWDVYYAVNPFGTQLASASVNGDVLYVAGGEVRPGPVVVDSVWLYTVPTDTWAAGAGRSFFSTPEPHGIHRLMPQWDTRAAWHDALDLHNPSASVCRRQHAHKLSSGCLATVGGDLFYSGTMGPALPWNESARDDRRHRCRDACADNRRANNRRAE